MRFVIPTQLFIFAVLWHLVDGLGINCRGSSNCGGQGAVRVVRRLTRSINDIDPSRWYRNGEQIACMGVDSDNGIRFYCAFLQNTGGAPGSKILELAHYIQDHGCKICGSVPYFYPAENDVSRGELTYNSVIKPCSRDDGLCPIPSSPSSAVGTSDICSTFLSTKFCSADTLFSQVFYLLSRCFRLPCYLICGSNVFVDSNVPLSGQYQDVVYVAEYQDFFHQAS